MNLFILFIAFFTSFSLYFLYKFLLNPYLQLLYYKKQGGICLFHWELISFFKNYRNARQKNDFYYLYKEAFRKNPTAPFLVENFGPKVLLIPNSPKMIKEILHKYEIYHKDKTAFKLMMDLTQETTAFNEDLAWKKRRKIISSAFNFEFIKEMIPITIEIAQNAFTKMIENRELCNIDLVHKLANLTGEATGRLLFGRGFSEEKIEGMSLTTLAIKLGNDLFNEAFSLSSLIFGTQFPKMNILPRHRRLNKTIANVRNRCKEIIEETERRGTKENNFINKLLDLRRNNNGDDLMTDDQIVGESIGLFAAGTDTTANIVGFAIYYLSRHPQALKKIREEVEREFEDIKSLTAEKLNKMDYTTAFLKEALRVGVGCLFYRIAVKDDILDGVNIKKGTLVNVFLSVTQSSDKYYSDADNFVPERWLKNSKYSEDGFKEEPYCYIPFSGGPRNCVGQHLAMLEAKILLGLFVKTFDFEFPTNFQLKFVQGIVYEPLDPLLINLSQRKREI